MGRELSQEEAEARLRHWHHWQRILRLQDWTIKVRIIRERDLWGSGQAEYRAQVRNRTALVMLVDPADWDPAYETFTYDHERSLVHELVHLKLVKLNPPEGDEAGDVELEQAVHDLSCALIEQERGGRDD